MSVLKHAAVATQRGLEEMAPASCPLSEKLLQFSHDLAWDLMADPDLRSAHPRGETGASILLAQGDRCKFSVPFSASLLESQFCALSTVKYCQPCYNGYKAEK